MIKMDVRRGENREERTHMSLSINIPNQYEIASAVISNVGVDRKISISVPWDEIS